MSTASLLQGAVAEQGSKHPYQGEAGMEDREGGGLLNTGAVCPAVWSMCPGPKPSH